VGVGGRLHFKHFYFWFCPLSLSLEFDDNLISGCQDIQLLIFWGCLPLEVVLISSILNFGLVPWALIYNFRKIQSAVAEIFSFCDVEVSIYWRSSLFVAFLLLVWSPEFKFEFWERSDQWLLKYLTLVNSGCLSMEVIFHWRSSSIRVNLNFKQFLIWFDPLSLGLKFQ
jgi:hypothetical protein